MTADRTAERGLQILLWLLDEREHERFLESLDDDVRWSIPGNWEGISGVKDRDEIAYFLKGLRLTFPQGFTTHDRHVTANETTAAIEFRGGGRTARGRDYENTYCLTFTFEGEQVREIREHMDTMVADRLLFSDSSPSPPRRNQ